MSDPLEEAMARAERRDWTAVTHLLQELPLETSLTESEWQAASQLALKVLERGDFQQQWEIAKVWAKLGEGAIPLLIALVEDPSADPDSRWFAGRILSQFNHPDSILALAKLLQETQEEDLALMAAQSLGHLGLAAVGPLQALLQVPESRPLAVLALAQIRRVETIPPLLQVAGDPLPAVREAAMEALGSFHDGRVLPVLLAALQDPAAAVRQAAIAALSRRHPAELPADFASQLRPLLWDLNPAVCQEAALALGRLGTEAAAAELLAAFQSPATPVALKRTAVLALSWIPTAGALRGLEEELGWSSPEICRDIVAALGRQEVPALKIKAVEILRDFLHSGQPAACQPAVKQLVAASLGDLGIPTAAAPLHQLAADADPGVRLHATAALKKIQVSQ